jgi:hypothetical protein
MDTLLAPYEWPTDVANALEGLRLSLRALERLCNDIYHSIANAEMEADLGRRERAHATVRIALAAIDRLPTYVDTIQRYAASATLAMEQEA